MSGCSFRAGMHLRGRRWALASGAVALGFLSPSVRAACIEPVSLGALASSLGEAEKAYSDLEIDRFVALTDELQTSLPCLDEPIEATIASRIHRLFGLRAFGERDHDAAESWFLAARRASPDSTLSDLLVPDEHPVGQLFAGADPSNVREIPTAPPTEGEIRFDGRPTGRPEGIPSVFQHVHESGHADTALLGSESPIPDYATVAVEVASSDGSDASDGRAPTQSSRAREHTLRLPLALATGAALVTTGILYGLGTDARADYFEADTIEELETLHSRTNGYAVGSSVAGAVALGAGIGLVLQW